MEDLSASPGSIDSKAKDTINFFSNHVGNIDKLNTVAFA